MKMVTMVSDVRVWQDVDDIDDEDDDDDDDVRGEGVTGCWDGRYRLSGPIPNVQLSNTFYLQIQESTASPNGQINLN